MAQPRQERPYWSQVLRSLREARGMTQDGWALQLGYGRATVRRWESGETVPSAHAEGKILDLCQERALFRRYTDGPLAGVRVTPDWLSDLLAEARLGNVERPSPTAPRPITTATTQYARSGDIAIAYQVFGSGPIDLVVTPGTVSHRELEWEHPGFTEFFERLASFARVIIFDKRGTGMSDRVEAGTLEERMDDIRAVMDAAGSHRAALFGVSEGGPMSILFAATYPERTRALLLYGAYACEWHPTEYPLGAPLPPLENRAERLRDVWGRPDSGFVNRYAPSVANDPAAHEWWARYLRISASPGAAIALITMNASIDVRHILPTIRVPTLVMHRRGDRAVEIEHGRYLAEHIPGARYVELEGIDHLPIYGDIESVTRETGAFLKDLEVDPDVESVLATVLTARVHSPAQDRQTPHDRSLETLLTIAHREISRLRGRKVSIGANHIVASFDGPSRAVRCARAIHEAASSFDLEARSGLHTGEVEVNNGNVSGVTLDVSAYVADKAGSGEILATSTVTDLIPGSGFQFTEQHSSQIPNAPGHLRLFSVLTGD
jgi:pimeloyl-ACP methyl ester carboxylesterase/transcriptional regulator with XRE-family HTH domain